MVDERLIIVVLQFVQRLAAARFVQYLSLHTLKILLVGGHDDVFDPAANF